jgi:6-pyruvoyl-tetrahydropterin synthase
VTVRLFAQGVPSDGMLMDFGEVDKVCKPIVDACDHRYLVSESNKAANDPYFAAAERYMRSEDLADVRMPTSSAEHLAELFYRLFQDVLTVPVHSVSVEETDRNEATYGRPA